MEKRTSFVVGVMLVLFGLLIMPFTFWGPLFGWEFFAAWRLWPLLVVGAGLLFVVPPFIVRQKRGLGGLFIPGVPILVTGAILSVTSLFNWWDGWSWLWPFEVLGVAAGFAMAALWMRCIWLLFPAIIIGANGLLLQFCAVTGWWSSWAVLWTVEPLAVGLALLIIGAAKHSRGLIRAGLIVCGVAGGGLVLMSMVLPHWPLLGWFAPAVLVLMGALLIFRSGIRRLAPAGPPAE